MAKVRTFTLGGTDALLPSDWLEAVKAPQHIRQGDVVAFAWSKKDLLGMYEDRGVGARSAEWLAGRSRWSRDGSVGTSWQMLIDDGVVDPTRPGIWVAHNIVKGSYVGEVMPNGSVELVARIGWDSDFGGPHGRRRGLFVEERLR